MAAKKKSKADTDPAAAAAELRAAAERALVKVRAAASCGMKNPRYQPNGEFWELLRTAEHELKYALDPESAMVGLDLGEGKDGVK